MSHSLFIALIFVFVFVIDFQLTVKAHEGSNYLGLVNSKSCVKTQL